MKKKVDLFYNVQFETEHVGHFNRYLGSAQSILVQ